MKFLNIIYYIIKNGILKIKDSFVDLWKSNKEYFKKSSLIEKLFIIGSVIAFAYITIRFALNTVVALIGITIVSMFIGQILSAKHLNLSDLSTDLFSPVIGIITFTISSLIYFIVPEIALLLSLFVIPQVAADMIDKYRKYEMELTPS